MLKVRLWWLLAAAFVFEMSYFALMPLVPLHFRDMGSSHAEVGLWMALSATIPAALVLFLGRMNDRAGEGGTLRLGALIFMIGAAGLALAPAPWVASLSLGLAYLGDAGIIIATHAYLSRLADPARRVQFYGWLGATMSVGSMAGPVIGGVVADWRGIPATFYMVVGVSVVAVTVIRFLPIFEPQTRAASDDPPDRNVWSGARRLVAIPMVRHALLIIFLLVLAETVRSVFYPLYLADIGLSPTFIGVLFSLYALASTVCRVLAGWLARVLGSQRLAMGAFLLTIVSVALIPVSEQFIVLAVLAVLMGTGHAAIQPVALAWLVEFSPAQEKGLIFGLKMTTQRVGGMVGPVVLGWVAGVLNVAWVFFATAGLMAAGMTAMRRLPDQPRTPRAAVTRKISVNR